jgi:phage head maturation protease
MDTHAMILGAAVQASSLNEEERSVTCVAYAGAEIFGWNGAFTLSLEDGAVDFSRVKAGAGVFTDHEHSVETQIGVITAGRLVPGRHVELDLRFARDERSDRYLQGVKDGIFQNLSIGAFALKKKDITPDGQAADRKFLATRWQPFEVSLVGVPADPNARFLSLETAPECELELDEVQGSAPEVEEREVPQMESTTVTLAGQTATPNTEALLAEERARVSTIHALSTQHGITAGLRDRAINDSMSVEAFRAAAFDELAEKTRSTQTNVATGAATTIIRDEADTRRELMAQAILHRIDPAKNQIQAGNDFRAMSCLRMAEESLVRAGVSVRGKSANELAILAMQNTADFPLVLENSARKLLLNAYSYATPTYKLWTKASTTPDFKTMSRTRLGETPAFLKVPEGAQITIANMTESREQYAIATYGRGISFTRQMLINDDLGAFNGLIQAFGVQASIIENKTVYAILTVNANMSDSAALFVAGHSNLGTGVIGNTALDAMFTAMGTQKGLDGVSVLNLTPKFLIVPKAKEATANAALTAVGPSVKASDQNWFAGRLQVVADGELDGNSTAVWYGAADPTIFPGIEYAHLEGANGPQMIREENGSGILGVNLYAFLDFGAKAVDWRPLYKSSGA